MSRQLALCSQLQGWTACGRVGPIVHTAVSLVGGGSTGRRGSCEGAWPGCTDIPTYSRRARVSVQPERLWGCVCLCVAACLHPCGFVECMSECTCVPACVYPCVISGMAAHVPPNVSLRWYVCVSVCPAHGCSVHISLCAPLQVCVSAGLWVCV